ncbi:tRNA (adenosine(37)-N6)-threonylcarbamoyltransferase complex ATPase subunit type 1 TsaE [Zhouia sp. PK063]|uniref:tRNA (adenosine(37)-N6)-threonylcarbamoyltransferase complex ATPase subunit type 1 TsaE n=1 Tax=Zhouia sp. PK063 TaxID=3373602 RepID=UPI00378E9851
MKPIEFNYSELSNVAEYILKNLDSKILLFKADMGSGKTTLIKELVKQLGYSGEISSPTFSIVNEYSLKTEKIYHFDLYRLKSIEELLDIGFEDYLYSGSWCFIEWPDMIIDTLTLNYNIISLKVLPNENRLLIL